jgi:anti-anti-sigma factor
MALITRTSSDGKILTIDIRGRFDFSMHQELRQVYEQAPGGTTQYIINLRQTEYMDSSALRMLLLLREHAGGDRAHIKIMHCQPEVKKILAIANFQHLFCLD